MFVASGASMSAEGLCVASGAGSAASSVDLRRASFAFRSVELGSGSTGGGAGAAGDRSGAPERSRLRAGEEAAAASRFFCWLYSCSRAAERRSRELSVL